ncbi:ATP phosphoribosyltransferase regulatory subunit [Paraburkholderia elongata]|uniref:ATP phosphoribosyltransferase regulatory subunit n=1 Tax=Paraburkholderia elongata TaxID=2675747 RepID=UPI001F399637
MEAGAEEAIVPALWGQDTFIQKAGGSEVIGQMWAFPDKKGRPCCLIPEATALFQERSKELLGQQTERMLFYVARCYRYERPQAGRYREFSQLGFEYLCPDPQRAQPAQPGDRGGLSGFVRTALRTRQHGSTRS